MSKAGPSLIHKDDRPDDSRPVNAQRVGEDDAIVEHDDGSKFEINTRGVKSEAEKADFFRKINKTGQVFRMGGYLDRDGRLVRSE